MKGKSIYLKSEEIKLLQVCIHNESERLEDNFNTDEERELYEKTLESLMNKFKVWY